MPSGVGQGVYKHREGACQQDGGGETTGSVEQMGADVLVKLLVRFL